MRVLFLTHRLPYPPNRGDRIRSYHILRHLSSQFEVDLLSLVHSAEEEQLAVHVRRFATRVETARVPRLKNLFRAVAALPGDVPLTHVLLDSPAIDTALAKLLSSSPPDIVLAYGSGMARVALHPRLEGIRFVLDMVDVDSVKWATLGNTARMPMRVIYRREADRLRRFEHTASTRAIATVVVNDREKAAMLAVNPAATVQVICNGIEIEHFTPREAPSTRANVVFCGVFDYEPNVRAAIWLAKEVWPLVRKARPDAKLTLVGMNPIRQVRALATIGSIDVTGEVPDVRPYLWRAAVSVAPLLVARGIQNKVLEAMAAGLPCVVTPQVAEGLPTELVGLYRIASNPADFAAKVVALLDRQREPPSNVGGPLKNLSWANRLHALTGLLDGPARANRRAQCAAVNRI